MNSNQPGQPKRASKIALAVLLGILTIPAAFIAFFATCVTTIDLAGDAALFIGGAAAVATIAGMVYGIVRLTR